jgi:hypothetical protein
LENFCLTNGTPNLIGTAMTQISYRVAGHDEETDILAILQEVAPEIPVRLDGPERQNKIQAVIIECHRSGKSWVAVDASGRVVGFVLARPDAHEGKAAISLLYAGVSANSRRHGIFATFIEKLKANNVTLKASVLHNNQSKMAGRLVKNGFAKVESDAKETRFRWTP